MTTKKKTTKRFKSKMKMWAESMWKPLGKPNGFGTYDVWNSQPEPSPVELISAFEECVYACTTLIAQNIAAVDLKLCYASPTAPKGTKRLTKKQLRRLNTYGKRVDDPDELVEVAEHPILKLLERPNPKMSYHDLMNVTEVSLGVVGHAYWWLRGSNISPVEEIWVLPAQNIRIDYDKDTGEVLAYVDYTESEPVRYPPEQVIHWKELSLLDPYDGGWSPLRSVWQAVQLGRKETSSWESVVTNMAKPSILISPKDDSAVGNTHNAERTSKQITQMFSQGSEGGCLTLTDPVDVNILNYPPKDMAALTLSQDIRTRVCFAFHVPPTMVFMNESNRASADAGNYYLMANCIKPRMTRILDTFNARLCPLFDSRLFFATDEIVPQDNAQVNADRDYELRKNQTYLMTGVMTRDEVREEEGLPPLPEPVVSQEQDQQEATVDSPEQADSVQGNDLRSTVGGLQAIAALQEAYYSGRIPQVAAVANVMLLFGFSQEEAEQLFPAVKPVPLTQPQDSPSAAPGQPQKPEDSPEPTQDSEQPQKAIKRLWDHHGKELHPAEVEDHEARVQQMHEELAQAKDAQMATKTWLAADNSCDWCKAMNGTTIPLDDVFGEHGNNPAYKDIRMPPAHPRCRCNLLYQDAEQKKFTPSKKCGGVPCADTKCGGEGGTPGPCPENKPDAPAASDKPSSDKPDAKPDAKPRSDYDKAKQEHQQRQEARDKKRDEISKQREAADKLTDVTTYTTTDDPVSEFKNDAAKLRAAITEAGVPEKEAAKLTAALDKAQAKMDKAGEKLTAAKEAQAEVAKQRSELGTRPEEPPEPDRSALDAMEASPTWDDEDPKYQAALADFEKAEAQHEKDVAAWEKEADKWDAKDEKLTEKEEKAEEKVDAAKEAADDAFSDSMDKVEEAASKANEAALEAADEAEEAIDAEEEADPEPEEPDEPDEEPEEE